ncbi:hypothetical protein SUGI_0590930 [Cryptomeria japonica]|nr:hypothetical protein SUGI_0590930 [Cryptomeria japonica]
MFDIYINNQTIEQAFDVAKVASGSNNPIYRDYVIYVPADETVPTDLWVALCPNSRTTPQYYNDILNGLEIYKLNDSSGNLAVLNPVVTEKVVENSAKGPVSSKHKGYTIGTWIGAM